MPRREKGRDFILAFFLLVFVSGLYAADVPGGGSGVPGAAVSVFPLILRLDLSDDSFRQYLADVELSRRRLFVSDGDHSRPASLAESLTVYQYTPQKGDDIFSLAARCNIPYAALASLNRISHPVMMETGTPLLLPSSPGLFIPEAPRSDLEQLLASARFQDLRTQAVALGMHIPGSAAGRSGTFYFFPGADFSSTERAFFLNPGFRFPLRSYKVTSSYGLRQNPFTGNIRLHEGLDLAAPAGTEVYAAAEGIVTEIGEDPIYGIYLVIKHGENWASLYGHLQKTETTLRSVVRSGNLIGRVGSTGQSTSPHLHFELRRNGRSRDPGKYLFQPGQQ
ncbi:MAG: M23 family metallopeptidase [Treponema sp.]|nr:M23 family metallopeptidase [Treponema sp.]